MMDGWKTDKLKNCISVESGYAFKTEDFSTTGIPVVKIGNIVDNTTKATNGDSYIQKEELSLYENYIIREGDVLIAMSGNTTCKMGRVSKAFSPSLVNQRVGWIKPLNNEIDIDFVYYLLQSESYQNKLWNYATATGQPNLSPRDICKISFQKPSPEEQSAIAAILSKVDEAIASVQASISAAERLKKSLMQNLLTGRMKPDGTLRKEDEFYVDEKFGRVPKGWEVKAIGDKDVCKINPVYKYKKKEVYDFIPMEAIKENFEGVDYVEKQVIDNGSYTRFKAGDILFAKITPCSENGKVAYIDHIDSEVGFASTEFIVFHPTENVDGKYVYLLLSSGNVHRLAISLMEGTTGRQRIPWKIFRNRIFVPMPDKEEQNKIVEKILVFDKKNSYNYSKIAVLERLKKSLMQNLLTGRVRVKE